MTLGYRKITNSIIPDSFDFYWQPPPPVYDPAKAKELLAEAGYPNGFDAGVFYCDSSYANMGEAAVDNLQRSGSAPSSADRAGRRSLRATPGKSPQGNLRGASGAFGNAATRLASFVVKGGAYVYGSYPDIDELYPQQADELDQKKRAAILDKIQQLVYEKAIYRADLAACLHQRGRAPSRSVGIRTDPRFRLHGSLRGHHDQGCLKSIRARHL